LNSPKSISRKGKKESASDCSDQKNSKLGDRRSGRGGFKRAGQVGRRREPQMFLFRRSRTRDREEHANHLVFMTLASCWEERRRGKNLRTEERN